MELNGEKIYSSLSDEITDILRGSGTPDEKVAAILAAADKTYDIDDLSDINNATSGGQHIDNPLDLDDNGLHKDRDNTERGKGIETGNEKDLNEPEPEDEFGDEEPEGGFGDEEPEDEFDNGTDDDRPGNGKESESKRRGRNSGGSRDDLPNDTDDFDDSEDFGDIDNMDADEAAEAAQQAADAAQQAADSAKSKANQASSKAQAAQQAAQQAQQEAEEAQAAAEQAQAEADAAQEAADNGGDQNAADAAKSKAEQAQQEADAAQAEAQQAQAEAQQAQAEADAAQQEAEQAQQEADAAQDAADRAKDAAANGDDESARENAKEATDAANRNNKNQKGGNQGNSKNQNNDPAQDAADQAQDAADQAQDAANQAKRAANKAQQAAKAAQDAADAAQEAADNGGDQDAADQAQQAANQAQDSADQASQNANQAQQAANQAQQAANQAQDAADSGDTESAEESAQQAQDAADAAQEAADQAKNAASQAQDSTQEAADKTRQAADGADEDSAQQAQGAADNADDAAQQSGNGQEGEQDDEDDTQQNNQNNDEEEEEEPEPDENEPRKKQTDFEKGAAFGEFIAGLIYGYGGNPDDLMAQMHFDEFYELPELPHLKVKNIHNIDFNESLHESLLLEDEDENILRDLRAAVLAGGSDKKSVAKILSALAKRKNGGSKEKPEPTQEPPVDSSTDVSAGETPLATNGDVDWTKVKIARADGDYDGTGDLFGENHVMTDEMRSQIQDARSSKLKKTLYDNESPFSSEDGLLKTITQISGRVFGKDFQNDKENPAKKQVERIKERIRANRKGFIDWAQELRKFLKGLRMGLQKTDFTTRTIIDPTAPPRFNKDPMVEAGNKIVIYLDVSGSVLGTPGVLAQVIAELKSIAIACQFKKMDVICFDDGILEKYCLIDQSPNEIRNPGWTINRPPGGGTVYDAVYKHMYNYYAMKKSTSAVIIFSDSDVMAHSNIFENWREKPENRSMAVHLSHKLRKKCMFIGIGESQSRMPEFKAATKGIVDKVVLVSAEEFTQAMRSPVEESNNNTVMNKIYYKVNNLNEALTRLRKPVQQAEPEPPVEPVQNAEPTVEPTENPAPVKPAPAKKKKAETVDDKLERLKKQAIARDNLNGGEVYEKDIDEWMQSVFAMWKLKKVVGTQAMLADSQTYCISLVNGLYKININNELTNGGGNRNGYGGKYSAQAITIPSRALLPSSITAGENIEIASIRGNVKISNFTGDKLPKFFPKRIIGNMDGNGGNLYISNCPNLASLENFPVSVDGAVMIDGKINISEEDLDAYDERLRTFDSERRASMGLPPIEDPEPKVLY